MVQTQDLSKYVQFENIMFIYILLYDASVLTVCFEL